MEKKQGAQGLPVGRNGHFALDGEMRQKRFSFDLPHVARMLQAMNPDEVFDPIKVSLFGSEAIVQIANWLAQLIQQPGGLENRQAGFFGVVMTVRFYRLPAASFIASGLARVALADVKKTTPMLGRHGSVFLY